MQALVSTGADVNSAVGPYHYTAMHIAALRNDTQMVRLLRNLGATIDATSDGGGTLHDLATISRHAELSHILDKYASSCVTCASRGDKLPAEGTCARIL